MKPDIRVCLGRILGLFYIKNGRIVGRQRDYQTFYYNTIFRDYNSTLIDKEITGGMIPGSEAFDGTFLYSGCLGSIQSNESDYILWFLSQLVVLNSFHEMGYFD